MCPGVPFALQKSHDQHLSHCSRRTTISIKVLTVQGRSMVQTLMTAQIRQDTREKPQVSACPSQKLQLQLQINKMGHTRVNTVKLSSFWLTLPIWEGPGVKAAQQRILSERHQTRTPLQRLSRICAQITGRKRSGPP